MNADLEIDEYLATAMPRDWAEDFGSPGGHELSCCERCLSTFRGFRFRLLCKVCAS